MTFENFFFAWGSSLTPSVYSFRVVDAHCWSPLIKTRISTAHQKTKKTPSDCAVNVDTFTRQGGERREEEEEEEEETLLYTHYTELAEYFATKNTPLFCFTLHYTAL